MFWLCHHSFNDIMTTLDSLLQKHIYIQILHTVSGGSWAPPKAQPWTPDLKIKNLSPHSVDKCEPTCLISRTSSPWKDLICSAFKCVTLKQRNSVFIRNNHQSIVFVIWWVFQSIKELAALKERSWLFFYSKGWEPEGCTAFRGCHGDFILHLPRELISRHPAAGNTNKPGISLANAGVTCWSGHSHHRNPFQVLPPALL